MEKHHVVMRFFNLPRFVCHIMIGRDHALWHRMCVGGVVMVSGVVIAKFGGHHFPADAVMHYVSDIVGYFIHALGAVPYLEWLIEEELE